MTRRGGGHGAQTRRPARIRSALLAAWRHATRPWVGTPSSRPARARFPFGLRAEGIAALAGLATLAALAVASIVTPTRAAEATAQSPAYRMALGMAAADSGSMVADPGSTVSAANVPVGLRPLNVQAAPRPERKLGPWTVIDLGVARKEEHCMEAASLALQETARIHGARLIRRTGWTVEALGLGGSHDAVIACGFGDNRNTRATLVLHSGKDGVSAIFISRSIDDSFSGHVRRITRAWLRQFDL